MVVARRSPLLRDCARAGLHSECYRAAEGSAALVPGDTHKRNPSSIAGELPFDIHTSGDEAVGGAASSDSDYGEFAVANRCLPPGRAVLCELPVVCTQQLFSYEAGGIRPACSHCLAWRNTLEEEAARLCSFLDADPDPGRAAACRSELDELLEELRCAARSTDGELRCAVSEALPSWWTERLLSDEGPITALRSGAITESGATHVTECRCCCSCGGFGEGTQQQAWWPNWGGEGSGEGGRRLVETGKALFRAEDSILNPGHQRAAVDQLLQMHTDFKREPSSSAGAVSPTHTDATLDVCTAIVIALASIWNERLLMAFQLLLRLRDAVLSEFAPNDHHPQRRLSGDASGRRAMLLGMAFGAALEKLLSSYAHGAMRSLNDRQRKLLRFAHKVIAIAIAASFGFEDAALTASTGPLAAPQHAGALTLQQLFTLHAILDANVHAVVVCHPLWGLLASLEESTPEHDKHEEAQASADGNPVDALVQQRWQRRQRGEEGVVVQRQRLRTRLQRLCNSLIPCEVLHCLGVALFDIATKFNHSCAPNVRFVPTVAPARALVITRAAVPPGAELRTSYIDLDSNDRGSASAGSRAQGLTEAAGGGSATPQAVGVAAAGLDVTSRASRIRFLQHHYGFTCDCPRCQPP